MRFLYTFKQMETSEALQELTKSKIQEKIERFSTKPIEAQITFSVERHKHLVQCSLKGGDGFTFTVEAWNSDMYSAVDRLVSKLETKLKRQKDKIKSAKGRSNVRRLIPAEKDNNWDQSIDAEDVIKFEQARLKRASGL